MSSSTPRGDGPSLPMELTYECPSCGVVNREPAIDRAAVITCRACGLDRHVREGTFVDGGLMSCAVCPTDDLYIQKDFPHGLGLGIVVVGFAVSSVFWALYWPVCAMAVLMLTAALDLVLYYMVPDVTICYRCLSQYRGAGSNPGERVQPFDLAIGERYRQERLRVEQLREERQRSDRQAADAAPPA